MLNATVRALDPNQPVLRGSAQNPDVFFQAQRGRQPIPHGRARSSPAGDGHLRGTNGPPLQTLRLSRERSRRRTRHGAYGIWGWSGARLAVCPAQQGPQGGCANGAAISPVRHAGLRRGTPVDRAIRRGSRPDQGTWFRGRTVIHRCRRRSRRSMGRPATVGNRRPVRTVIERVHATHGRGRVRRADPGQTPTPHHGWHHRRRDRIECHCRSNMERTRDHATSIVLRSRKRWNRWRKQEHGEDRGQPHRPIRPGLLRLRLEEVRVDDRVSSAVLTRSDRVHLSCRSRPTSLPVTGFRCSTAAMRSSVHGQERRCCSMHHIPPTICGATCPRKTSA